MTTTVDTRGFMKAMALYRQARLNKSYPYIVNRCLRNVAATAIGLTKKSDSAKIRAELTAGASSSMSIIASYRRVKGQGKVYTRRKKPRIVTQWDNSVAARIINARRAGKAKGILGKRFNVGKYKDKHLLWGVAMDKAAEAMVRSRIKAISFIRAGWLPAFLTFVKLTGREGTTRAEAQQRGRPKGSATPANKGQPVVYGEMVNTARGAARVGMEAAQMALRVVSRDIARWALKELGKQAKKAGLRTG